MKKAAMIAIAAVAGLSQFGCSAWETVHAVVYHAMDISEWLKVFKFIP